MKKPFGRGHYWFDRNYYSLAKLNSLDVDVYFWTLWISEYFVDDAQEWFDDNKNLWAPNVGTPNQRWNLFIKHFCYKYVPANIPVVLIRWFKNQPMLQYDVLKYLERLEIAWRYLVLLDQLVFSRLPDYFHDYTMFTIPQVRRIILQTQQKQRVPSIFI